MNKIWSPVKQLWRFKVDTHCIRIAVLCFYDTHTSSWLMDIPVYFVAFFCTQTFYIFLTSWQEFWWLQHLPLRPVTAASDHFRLQPLWNTMHPEPQQTSLTAARGRSRWPGPTSATMMNHKTLLTPERPLLTDFPSPGKNVCLFLVSSHRYSSQTYDACS